MFARLPDRVDPAHEAGVEALHPAEGLRDALLRARGDGLRETRERLAKRLVLHVAGQRHQGGRTGA